MTNHEKYKEAFSVLQPTRELELEDPMMNNQKKTFTHKRVLANENGETTATFGGGGVAMGKGGKERPLTPEEVLEGNELDVVVDEDGKATLYFRDRTYDITDLFNADGVCKVKLKDENRQLFKTVYMDIKLEGEADDPFAGYGYSTSSIPHGVPGAYTALDG